MKKRVKEAETHKKKGKEEKGLLTKCNYLHHKLSDLN